MLESLFNKVVIKVVFKICKIFKNTFFHRTALVAASAFAKFLEMTRFGCV